MKLISCIERIPSLITKRKSTYGGLKDSLLNYLNNQKVEKIIFVASGTSYNAANVTKYFANNISLKIECYYPNTFCNYVDVIDSKALYVFISQGGATKLVFDSLVKVKQKGLKHISITESLDSPIAKEADSAIEMGSENEEFLYRTIGYSLTLLTCCLVELAISNSANEDEILSDIDRVTNNLGIIQKETTNWYAKYKFSLMKRNKCILAGPSYLYEVANEADIKIMEMIPMITRSFELEELIHGPQNAFDDSTIFFLLADENIDVEKTKAIKKFITEKIGFCSIIGDYGIDDKDLVITYQSKYFKMLESITPFQMLAYYLAEDHGRDLTRGVNACISQYIKKTL